MKSMLIVGSVRKEVIRDLEGSQHSWVYFLSSKMSFGFNTYEGKRINVFDCYPKNLSGLNNLALYTAAQKVCKDGNLELLAVLRVSSAFN